MCYLLNLCGEYVVAWSEIESEKKKSEVRWNDGVMERVVLVSKERKRIRKNITRGIKVLIRNFIFSGVVLNSTIRL